MERLSYTKIDTFKKCPYQFKRLYIDKDIVVKDSEALRYGSFLHTVLEDIGEAVKENNNEIPDDIKTTASESWRKNIKKYAISKGLQEESRGILYSYGQKIRNDRTYKIIGNERKFDMKIGEFLVTGKIDQILENDKHMLIRDFKTNKDAKYLKADPLQLKMYALAVSKELGIDPEKIQTSFMFLRLDCDEFTQSFSKEELDETEEYLKSIGYAIKKATETKTFKASPGPLCPYCPVLTQCDEAKAQAWIMRKYSALVLEGKVA